MEEAIINEVDNIANQMIEAIKDIVKINSVESEPKADAPFGVGIKKALDATLSLANSLGLETINMDNYIGYAKYGNSKDYVCAIGHLDVVPVGVGWKHPPFSAHEENGFIFGRGILDNKGPIIACLFALYALKRLQIPVSHEIRVIFGCNEETGFNDINYYLKKEKPPIMGFTPDCKFPVVYAERGRAILEIQGDKDNIPAFFDFLNTYILNAKNNGERFNIGIIDSEFGQLEMRNYQVLYKESPTLRFSVSYPASITCQQIEENIKKELPSFFCQCVHNFNPVYFNTDSFLIKALVDAYEKVTKKDGTPVTTTGGTYAKIIPNIVPFGPSFPGQKGIGHQPNEWMKIEDIITNTKIYAISLYNLTKLK